MRTSASSSHAVNSTSPLESIPAPRTQRKTPKKRVNLSFCTKRAKIQGETPRDILREENNAGMSDDRMSLCLLSVTRSPALKALPLRGPPPPKKKAVPMQKKTTQTAGDVPLELRRYRPHLPEALVAETVSFLRSSSKLRCLLDFIFSPKEGKDTEADRRRLQRSLEEYHFRRQQHDAPFVLREAAAAAAAWRALAALPQDLHEEAIQSSTAAAPVAAAAAPAAAATAAQGRAAQLSEGQSANRGKETPEETEEEDWEAYRQQSFPEELAFHQVYRQQIFDSLTPLEKRKLQVFHNLMHIRFPHAELKRREPHLFWISERQAVGRQKEQALKARTTQASRPSVVPSNPKP
ncbi:hypothetical protein Esti_000516 [Eimeria stiedai]